VAAKFGQLPDTIERQMSKYWFNRTVLFMDAETLDQERRNDEMEKARK
jgi:hypothetical protein